MLHFFSFTYHDNANYYVWDIEAGSLATLSYPAFLVAKKSVEGLSDEELQAYNALTPLLVEEVTAELDECGLLKCDAAVEYRPAYSGDVKAMCLHICHDCNLCCRYCFAAEGTYNTARDYMSFEVGKNAIDFLLEHSGKRKHLEVDFFGGEPLLNMQVVKDIVAYANEKCAACGKKISFTMTTNALLLNESNAAYLNETMDNVVISIDGRKEVHNANRKSRGGADCYDIIMKNAKHFRHIRGNGRYYIRGTYTSVNKDFSEDARYLSDCGFDQLSLEPVVLEDGNPLGFTEGDLPQLYAQYDKLAELYLDRYDTDKWFNFFHFMLDLEHGPCVNKRAVGCGAGNEYVAVTPTGEIYPCHQFAGDARYKMGDVFTKEFNRDIQRTFAQCNLYSKQGCTDCFAKYFCSGGCVANAVHFNGDMNVPYAFACKLMRKRLELSLAIQAILRENKN